MNDTLSGLRHQRDDIASRLADLMNARERLRQAQGAETAVIAEIGALGALEIEALKAWSRTGEGEKPAPDIAARSALHDKLASAQASAANARGVNADLDTEQRDLTAQLQSTSAKIDEHAMATLQREHAEAVTSLQAWIAASVQPRIAHVLGLRAMITNLAQQHQGSGRGDQAMALFQVGERVGRNLPALVFEPTQACIVAAASTWSKRLAELQGDVPATNVVKIGSAA